MTNKRNTLKAWCLDEKSGSFGIQLMEEWLGLDEFGNTIEMDDYTRSSADRVQWRCKEGHTWTISIKNRVYNKSYCPECRHGISSLHTKEKDILSLSQWCKENGEYGNRIEKEWVGKCKTHRAIDFEKVAHDSNYIVKWECMEHKHTWYSRINDRTIGHHDCPICTEDMPVYTLDQWCKSNENENLSDEENIGKQIRREFTGLDKYNNVVDIASIYYGSSRALLWKCIEGHVYTARVSAKTHGNGKCPYCSGRIKIDNDTLSDWLHRDINKKRAIVTNWISLDEDGNAVDAANILMDDIYTNAIEKRYKFKCENGHIYLATLQQAIKPEHYCPYCKMRYKLEASGNSLLAWCSDNYDLGKQIRKEFEAVEQENNLGVQDVSYNSKLEVNWKCEEGHIFKMEVHDRTIKHKMCPYCQKIKEDRENKNLYNWCIDSGRTGSRILREWAGLDKDKNNINMVDYSVLSEQEVYWKCKNSHLYLDKISNHIKYMTACPECRNIEIKENEKIKFIHKELKRLYPSAKMHAVLTPKLVKDKIVDRVSIDIAIPENGICLEFLDIANIDYDTELNLEGVTKYKVEQSHLLDFKIYLISNKYKKWLYGIGADSIIVYDTTIGILESLLNLFKENKDI